MNIVEAITFAKEYEGKKVRPVGEHQCVSFKEDVMYFINLETNVVIPNGLTYFTLDDILSDWEVVKEKPSKETQYKIDSMKFQIVRHCKNGVCGSSCELDGTYCELDTMCRNKIESGVGHSPKNNMLDDWNLKEIVEAYHILKKAGEI